MKRRTSFLLFLGLACSSGLFAAGLREQVGAYFLPAQELLRSAALHPTALNIALMVLVLGLMPFSVVVPMTVGSLAAGALLPAWLAPPVILGGMLLNTFIAWFSARTVIGHRIERWLEGRGGALGGLRAAAKRAPFKWSLLSRFIPIPFFAPPMVLASAGVPLRYVMGATALAMTPWSFAYAWAGREGREGSLGSLALAGTCIAAIAVLSSWAYRRYIVPAEAEDARNSNFGANVPDSSTQGRES